MTLRKPVDTFLGRAALATLGLGILILGLAGATPPAEARHDSTESWMQLPDVSNLNEAQAIAQLEALGLRCRTENVAGDRVGHVLGTVPAIGSWIDRTQEIVLRVAVPVRVQTIVPRVRRRNVDQVVSSLQDIYAIAVRPVRGPARHEGRVVGQLPRAGAQLPFRGILTLDVVDNRVTVPFVEGMRLRRALARIEEAGLQADVREVATAGTRRPTVLRQRQRAGSRVAIGTSIRLRVAVPTRGHRPGGHVSVRPMGVVTVPHLIGLTANAAAQQLQALGLTARVNAISRRGAVVATQSITAGSRARLGSEVTLTLRPRARRFGWGR